MIPTYAEIIVEIGKRHFGPNWLVGMADLTGVNLRTLERIQAAAQHGEEYPAARGVIGALHEALTAVLAHLEPWAQRADAGR